MLKLIENGEVYTPDRVGVQSILLAGDKIVKIGEIDGGKLASSGLECEVIDATGCYVTPGFIDPHQHILGAGGEQGYSSRSPEVTLSEILRAGTTTVVGCLGTDGTSRHLTSLLSKARGLENEGVTTYIYTGNFQVPTPTITASILDDIVIIDKVIGIGEIAISDVRSSQPTVQELARIVSQGAVASILTGKAGVTHFHVGPTKKYLSILHTLLDEYDIDPKHIHATHITRSKELMDDAIKLARRGAYVDTDTIDEGMGEWLKYYLENDGPPSQFTLSSDAHAGSSTNRLYEEFVSSVLKYKLSLDTILPFFTLNTATVLKLENKGRLAKDADADVLVLKKDTLEIKHLFARGRHMIKDGEVIVKGWYEQ